MKRSEVLVVTNNHGSFHFIEKTIHFSFSNIKDAEGNFLPKYWHDICTNFI